MATGANIHSGTVWPENGDGVHWQAVSTVFFFTATALLSFFLSRRVPSSWASWKNLSLARVFVILTLADSCLFIYFSGILVLGVGTSLSEGACAAGIWWCIALYATSKIFIYLFLLERLHVVWSRDKDGRERGRLQSPMYRIASLFLLCWVAVAICMIIGRVSFIRSHDSVCVIGLKLFATLPMLIVDAIVNVYLTASFVIPIYRSRFTSAQSLAWKSSLAAIAALITSAVNIAILTVLHGKQLSWVCLTSCGLDVFLNAAIIFMVTTGGASGAPAPVVDMKKRPSFASHFGGSASDGPWTAERSGSFTKRPSIVSLNTGRRASYQSYTNTHFFPGKKPVHPSEGVILTPVPQSPPMDESYDSSQVSPRIEDEPHWSKGEVPTWSRSGDGNLVHH